MTVQRPEGFICRHKDVKLEGYFLGFVTTGNPVIQGGYCVYEFSTLPKPVKIVSSALWRGYVSHYLLDEHGHLYLQGFEYPGQRVEFCDIAHEKLTGDFYLAFSKGIYIDRTYVPFKDGVVVTDESLWIKENTGRTRNSWMLEAEAKFLEENNCFVSIDFGVNALAIQEQYTVYIDGNIASTHKKDIAPKNSILMRVKQGDHRIVVRELDYKKKDRKESETLYFSVTPEHEVHFRFRVVNDELQLSVD